jgi:hypothetical protein
MNKIKPYLLLQMILGLVLLLIMGSALIRFRTGFSHSDMEVLSGAKLDRLTSEYLKPENRLKLRALVESTRQLQLEVVTMRESGQKLIFFLFCYSALISGTGLIVVLKARSQRRGVSQ